jgi:hypothetical protein
VAPADLTVFVLAPRAQTAGERKWHDGGRSDVAHGYEIDHRPDHAQLAVWATIALIDIAMFVLAVVSANLALGAAQTAMTPSARELNAEPWQDHHVSIAGKSGRQSSADRILERSTGAPLGR